MTPLRVLIADDQELIRIGFGLLLDAVDDLDVVAVACDGLEAVSLTEQLRPDVVLMDIRMPGLDGIEATRRLAGPGVAAPTKVLILTTFDLDEYVYGALRAGASGFLLKDAPRHLLLEAVRVVAHGDALLSPSVTRRLIADFARRPFAPPRSPPAGLGQLTPREREVLGLVATGLSNAEIAAQLFVAEATVKTHVGNVLGKLGLRDRIHIVISAYEHALVTPGGGVPSKT